MTISSERYSDWSNYETWVAALHGLEDFRGMYREGEFESGYELAKAIRTVLEEWVDEAAVGNPLLDDLLRGAIHDIDYRELADFIVEEEQV